jgi:hypothetical protein
LTAPLIILIPGINRRPAKKLPMRAPSVMSPLPWVSATEYRIISIMDPKVALITAPMPKDDWAEIDETAMPMKYDRGITDASPNEKMTSGEVRIVPWPRTRVKTYSSKMVKRTTGIKLMKMMLVPS